jgi:transposase-like protein
MSELRRGIRRRSRSDWQDVLARLESSGEEVSQFCRREGIHLPTLRWWRWHLAGSGGRDERPARRSELAVVDRSGPSFAELRVLAATADEADGAACFELRWSDGLTLVIPQQFDGDALQRLLAVLEVGGC